MRKAKRKKNAAKAARSKTSQSKRALIKNRDGSRGGEKRIVGRGTAARISAATNVNPFTVLGFTAATGEPVMYGVVI
jgi:hypothetical protein